MQSITLLLHGSQNSELQTISAIYGLPIYNSKSIKRSKICAAKILTAVADKSIKEARQLEQAQIRASKDSELTVRISADGAYPNRAGNKSVLHVRC